MALLLLAGGLCGCENNNNRPTETRPKTETTDYGTLGQKDWGARACSILGVYATHEPSFEIYAADNTGDNVNKAVFDRNSEIESLFNVRIIQVGDENSADRFGDDILTGAATYDIAFLYRDDMATAIANQNFVDILGLPYIDLTQDYYTSATIDSMKIGGKLFHMVSDFSLVDKSRITTLYFNRDMADDNGITTVIDDVKAKKWTFEQFATYVKQVSLDKNADEKMSYKDDQYGVTIGSKDESIAFWSAMGAKTVSIDQSGNYYFDYASDLAIRAADKIKDIFTNSDYYYASQTSDEYKGAGLAFEEGRALFYGAVMSSLPSISSNTDFMFTVLPFPMIDTDTQTRYYSNNNNTYCATFGVPTCAKDTSFSGFMIEALSWKSTDTTRQAYIDVNCKTKHSYDQVCSDMMTILFDSLSFDFGFLYDDILAVDSNTPKSIVSGCLRYTDRSLATYYSGNATQQKKRLDKLLKKITETKAS